MKKFAYLVLGSVAFMTLAAALQPAEAVCVSARRITSGASYVITPGYESLGGFNNSSVSPDFVGHFWAIGAGDIPLIGGGIDNGNFGALGGWVQVYANYPALINSTWAANVEIDGCVDFAELPRCMAILLMDNSGDTGTGAFALLTDEPDELLNFDFEQPGLAPINLTTVPALSITGSVRTSTCSITTTQPCSSGADCPAGETCVEGTGVDVSVDGLNLATIADGLYLDPNCPQPDGAAPVIEGYQVYSREVPRGSPPPTDTDTDNWTPVGPVTPLGEPSTVSLGCTGDTDQYLTTGIVFDSATASTYVSGTTTRFECGANLAEPEEIQRKPRNRELPRSRSRGR